MTTLRSVVAYLASMIRCTAVAYIVVQAVIWRSFYAQAPWRLVAPVLAVAWSVTVIVYLRRRQPSALFAGVDSAFYVALALGAQACVPPAVRDSAFSWLVIAMSGQLIVPAWYAPGVLSRLLTLSSPVAYWVGAALQPVTDSRTMTGAAILLLIVGLVHGWGRRALYGSAAVADGDVDRADQNAREQYAVLCTNIERREHERLLHDTVLNTLTALARGSGDAAEVVTRCRQDVALIEAALGGGDDLATDSAGSLGDLTSGDHTSGDQVSGDLLSQVRAVVDDMRARGLTIHLESTGHFGATGHFDGEATGGMAVPARVIVAISSVVREALSNVVVHAGTGEAWVSVSRMAHEGSASDPAHLLVIVRDRGAGFDPAHVDPARLGLRRSITERTAECGGQASIWSEPGLGTEVSVSWPAPDPAGQEPAGPEPADHGILPNGPPW
jgi:signal transduction histidine kinase